MPVLTPQPIHRRPGPRTLFRGLLAVICCSAVTADQFDPPPVKTPFKGVVSGKVKWIHNSTWWFMLEVESLKPDSGDPAVYNAWRRSKKGLKVALTWVGPKRPHAKQHAYLKSLKPGQRITARLEPGHGGKGVRLSGDPNVSPDSARVQPAGPEMTPPAAPRGSFVAAGASLDEDTVQHVLRVDPNDASAHPTIAAAWPVAAQHLEAGEPTRLKLAPGVYREGLGLLRVDETTRDTLLVIEGAGPGKTVWSGSDVWGQEKWQDLGEGLYAAAWPHHWGHHCYVWETPRPLGHRSEMVFVDGELMSQVLIEQYQYERTGELIDHGNRKHSWKYQSFREPKTAMPPGTFGVAERDKNGNRLYLRLPAGKTIDQVTVEVAQRRNPFRFDQGGPFKPGKNRLVLKGITFQHFASRTKDWGAEATLAIGREVDQLLIEGCEFLWNNAMGLQLSGRHITVRNTRASYNGFSGMGGSASAALLEGNVTNFNNWRGAWGGLRGWNWGGVKLGGLMEHQVVRNHQSIGNLAPGFWYDIHPRQVVLENLTLVENDGPGLFLELSQGPYTVRRLLSAGNRGAQFNMSIVGEFTLEDSILWADDPGTVKLKEQSVPKPLANLQWYLRKDEHARQAPIVPTAFRVRRCVFLAGPAQRGMISEHNGVTREHANYPLVNKSYRGEGNLFHSLSGSLAFNYVAKWWKPHTADLAGWQAWTRESDPQLESPGFRDPAGYDFRLAPGSPLAARAASLPLKHIDPALIAEARRLREWVEIGIGANPVDTD